ncbi:DUF11 domain-containing protein [Actinomadura rupiterrae]|uniref:DUF11 domain-containing protein n=1 Tax=Actinomadura rupiterrae TaxID=559627 RepID=UPI0020A4E66F|nr:DUF11 domain-containing protein [Actinomadura rupiterrae]MCP2340752.1 hypothetical protein [Actinomadura rupiterrae]
MITTQRRRLRALAAAVAAPLAALPAVLAAPLAAAVAAIAMAAATIGLAVATTGSATGSAPASAPGSALASARRAGPRSSTVGVNLDVTGIPAIGQPAFTGRLGTATTGDATERDQADYAHDPDGVKSLVTIANPSGSTSGNTAVGAWDATSDPNVFAMSLKPGAPQVLDVAAVHTYAQCEPPHAPQVQNYVTAPTFAERLLADGENSVDVTGAQLGYPDVTTGTLKVTMTRVQKTTPDTAAEARVVFDIEGTLNGARGVLYRGPIAKVVLGDVRAQCTGMSPNPAPGELVVHKSVDKRYVRVGDTVRYTITAQNVGGTTMLAHFTDDMSKVLKHGDYNHDAHATKGRVAYREPYLVWTGRLAPGDTAKITFTVTARSVGRMPNVVVWDRRPVPPPPTPAPKPTESHHTDTDVVPKHVK